MQMGQNTISITGVWKPAGVMSRSLTNVVDMAVQSVCFVAEKEIWTLV